MRLLSAPPQTFCFYFLRASLLSSLDRYVPALLELGTLLSTQKEYSAAQRYLQVHSWQKSALSKVYSSCQPVDGQAMCITEACGSD